MYELRRLLDSLKGLMQEKVCLRVSDYILQPDRQPEERFMILRCDVDQNPAHALYFAALLKSIDGVATFYFRARHDLCDPGMMRAVQSMGHEVGLHYECLDRCQGDLDAAGRMLLKEVRLFREAGIDVRTIHPHGELGLRKKAHSHNLELVAQRPGLLKEGNLVGEAIPIRQYFSLRGGDTIRSYKGLWESLEKAKTAPNFHLVIHPHRWRFRRADSRREVRHDLLRAAANWLFGRRPYPDDRL